MTEYGWEERFEMAICKECGTDIPDSSIFCGSCGAAQSDAYAQPSYGAAQDPLDDAPHVSERPQPAYEAPAYEAPVYVPQEDGQPAPPAQRPPKGSPYAVVGSWGFFFSIVLLSLPVVGWIFTIVWACGGIHNYNLQRLARAYIIGWVVMIVFYVAVFLLGGLSVSTVLDLLRGL